MEESAGNKGMTLCLALSYGGREDILQATRRLCQEVRDGRLDPAEIKEVVFEARLSTSELPPLDLMIRTSGELRISNFLLWQVAYAELFFTPAMWPEFGKQHLLEAIDVYRGRERRFGMTSGQLKQASTTK
jgi:undecaprenyl diphosphate synthase